MKFAEIFIKMRLGGITSKSYGNIIKGNLEIAKSWRKNKGNIDIFYPERILRPF